MKKIEKSNKLENVCYDIRGPVLTEALRLERLGHKVLKLNIGNPAAFGFDAPDEMREDLIANLLNAQGYSESKGVFAARKAIMHETQRLGVQGVGVEDIYIGNGVSELIIMTMNALLDNGDEVLVPMPDYPLWTAAVNLSGGVAVHYYCDESNAWNPDVDDIRAKITPRTKAIVLINPNNPTGAVYSRAVLKELVLLAEEHGMIIYSDEIYDKILYEDAIHIPTATLVSQTLCVTFNGLSKNYRAAGFRAGWLFLSGNKEMATSYIDGLNILSSMRLCANVPAQYAIQTALGGYQSIYDLTAKGGRLREQRDLAYHMIKNIEGLSLIKPMGAIYNFVKIDTKRFNISDDERFVMDLLREKHILLVHGRAFNWPEPDHFRVVTLPHKNDLETALKKLEAFLKKYKQIS
ncbi:pyridoxal phosphate-dependent aminotransferase [Rappaport israeli]|uniref:pyridoxal phosphate-dependent aminotransferase n=1 Tax=Rappaport israeli TaxID=1839807 RepID=UPI000931C15A|nr:pyridoxal phosphate-dependent aminotransferase [Rappaport israeli]